MKIIVPMAGMGKRMRPHTLTIPKPLIPIAGKPIVQRLVEDIAEVCGRDLEEIGFVVGHFGEQVEKNLLQIADSLGAKGHIFYQEEALGTAHAILCAQEIMKGPTIVAFADTLFKAEFELDESMDGILWTQKIPNPEHFGVVVTDKNNVILDYVEKPVEFVSDQAMIGIYYFKNGEVLREELQYLIDHNIIKGGEYQLPDALRNMTNKGLKFSPGSVTEWLDCGNKNATVYTNQRILELKQNEDMMAPSAVIDNSVVVQPCYIGENVKLHHSVVGPHVSIGHGSVIENSVVSNSIIQENSTLRHVNLSNSMIGNQVSYTKHPIEISMGDFSVHE